VSLLRLDLQPPEAERPDAFVDRETIVMRKGNGDVEGIAHHVERAEGRPGRDRRNARDGREQGVRLDEDEAGPALGQEPMDMRPELVDLLPGEIAGGSARDLRIIVGAHVAIGEVRKAVDVDRRAAIGEIVGEESAQPGVARFGIRGEPEYPC
jgi:hypothetical protein